MLCQEQKLAIFGNNEWQTLKPVAKQRQCGANQKRLDRLRYWIRVFKPNNTTTEKSTSWISVDTSELKVISKEQPLIVNIGNASMEINSDFNKDLFLKVTELLLSLC